MKRYTNSPTPQLGIVILNYLNFEDVFECIETIKNQTLQNYQIVIVDNASPNGAYQQLEDKYRSDKKVDVIKTAKNLGFARGNNVGIKYLKEKYQLYNQLVINADTYFNQNDYFDQLMNYKIDKSCALIGTKIINKEGYNQSPLVSAITDSKIDASLDMFKKLVLKMKIPRWIRKLKNRILNKKVLEEIEISQESTIDKPTYLNLEEECLHGAALYFTEFYLKKYIDFFPETFLYREEDFLALVCQKTKMKQLYLPQLEIQHKEGASTIAADGSDKDIKVKRRAERLYRETRRLKENVELDDQLFLDKMKEK